MLGVRSRFTITDINAKARMFRGWLPETVNCERGCGEETGVPIDL